MKMKSNKITIPVAKPRNPLVHELFKLKSGSHEKPEKSLRRKTKIEIAKKINEDMREIEE